VLCVISLTSTHTDLPTLGALFRWLISSTFFHQKPMKRSRVLIGPSPASGLAIVKAAQRIKPGDRFVCYMTKLSRWVEVLQVESEPFIDDSPRFYPDNDPFTVRFRVRPVHWLSRDKAIPIHEDQVWNRLSFTKGQEKNTSTWTGKLRGSLVQLSDEEGKFLEELITGVSSSDKAWPIEDSQWRRFLSQRVRGAVKDIPVTVPEDSPSSEEEPTPSPRYSRIDLHPSPTRGSRGSNGNADLDSAKRPTGGRWRMEG
jgi:hypothetical protein